MAAIDELSIRRTSGTSGLSKLPQGRLAPRTYIRENIFLILILSYLLFPAALLQTVGWRYAGGGSEIEKILPTTYGIWLFFVASIVFSRSFRDTVIHTVRTDISFVAFAVSVAAVTLYSVLFQKISIAPFVESLVTPLAVLTVLVSLSDRSIKSLRVCIEAFMVINILLIMVEYQTKHNLLPVYTGDAELLTSLARPAGLFGHPLSAASSLSFYGLLCIFSLPPVVTLGSFVRPLLAGLSLAAATTTGGRTAVGTILFVLALYAFVNIFKGLAVGHFRNSSIISGIFFGAAILIGFPVLWSLGVFDLLLLRLENDSGSAIARDYALQILFAIPLDNLWFGIPPIDALRLQRSYGIIAIELSWVNYILACGVVLTVPFFITFLLFLFRSMPRYCSQPIYFAGFYFLIVVSSSNGLWAKGTGLSLYLVAAFAFLKRESQLQLQR
jgi:hypothetical protein